MAEEVGFGVMGAIFGLCGARLFFLLAAGGTFVGFSVCLFLSIFKTGYDLKKRLWFLILIFIFYALLKARASITGESDFSPFLLCFGGALFLPVYFIRVKPVKSYENNEREREYVRLLEDKIKRADAFAGEKSLYGDNTAGKNAETEMLKAEPQPTCFSDKPDFSHVKNVLERLEPASLTYADRRQIHELEMSMYEAERGEYSEETRVKINEGLGNLLKIMARHGV